jgi:hypothetical protein
VTFNLVCVAWVFFRAPTFADASNFLAAMLFGSGTETTGWPVLPTLVVLLCAVLHLLERQLRLNGEFLRAAVNRHRWGPIAQAAAFGSVTGLAIALAAAGDQFIYFQF